MIDVSKANSQARELDNIASELEVIIKKYRNSNNLLEQNQGKFIDLYMGEISEYIKDLNSCAENLRYDARKIREKAASIRKEEEAKEAAKKQ